METQFTVRYTGRLAARRLGRLAVGAATSSARRSPTASARGNIYVEQSKDTPGARTTEGSRHAGGNRTILPNNTEPVTIKMRYTRANGSNTVQAQYQVMAPAGIDR